MIPPESKAKLEDKAKESYSKVPWQYVNNSSFDSVYRNGFMAGATAAWKMATELAVKAERERCAGVVDWAIQLKPNERNTDTWEAIKEAILNPPKDEAEK